MKEIMVWITAMAAIALVLVTLVLSAQERQKRLCEIERLTFALEECRGK